MMMMMALTAYREEKRRKQKRNLMQTLTIHNECSILFRRIRLGLFGLGHLDGATKKTVSRTRETKEIIIIIKTKKLVYNNSKNPSEIERDYNQVSTFTRCLPQLRFK